MKQNINLSVMLQSIGNVTKSILRFHYLIFIVFIVVGMFFAVYNITNILSLPEDAAYKEQQQKNNINDNFDEETIDKINKLRFSSDSTSLPLPEGRISPFTE